MTCAGLWEMNQLCLQRPLYRTANKHTGGWVPGGALPQSGGQLRGTEPPDSSSPGATLKHPGAKHPPSRNLSCRLKHCAHNDVSVWLLPVPSKGNTYITSTTPLADPSDEPLNHPEPVLVGYTPSKGGQGTGALGSQAGCRHTSPLHGPGSAGTSSATRDTCLCR